MSLKSLNKKNKQATPQDMLRLLEAVKQLTGKGILQVDDAECKAWFFKEVWVDRDDNFKKQWCLNILTYWCITHKVIDRYKPTLELYSLDVDKKKIGTFTLRGGFVPVPEMKVV